MYDGLLTTLFLVLGGLLEEPLAWVLAAAGALLVFLVFQLRGRLERLEREVKRLRFMAEQVSRPGPEPGLDTPPATGVSPQPAVRQPPSAPAPDRAPAARPPPAGGSSRVTTAPLQAAPVARGSWTGWLFGGGNWLVRGGIVLLFIGVGFLLKFAADHALLPVELRLASVAAGGVALVALGLRLVARRRAYALALQGGGVGLLYLTLYASFRLYGLLPASVAFALMFLVVVLAGWLAWKQDALVLAVLGAVGGFAAPVLASTGSGSHVALFSYYALLNGGVLGLAFARSWRPLNLVGFTATFIVGGLWGYRFYEPAYFASVEPFLILFFAMYLAVSVLFALHRRLALADPMDATLVFGTPLVAFGLQSRLVADMPHGLTVSAAALALLYATLWYGLRRRHRQDLSVLAEAFAALALGFATVTLALAFDARWTSASWALEGAALVWVGWRQRRALARLAGAALQAVAGAAWLFHVLGQSRWESGDWFGTLALAVAGLVSSASLNLPRDATRGEDERPLGIALGVWGLLFLGAGTGEQLSQWLSAVPLQGALLLAAAAIALSLDALGSALRWPLASVAARCLPLLLAGLALSAIFVQDHPLQSLAASGWPLAMVSGLWILHRQDHARGPLLRAAHLLWLWLLAALSAWEAAWWLQRALPAVESWQRLAWLLAPAAIVAAVSTLAARARPWPFPAWTGLYLGAGAGPMVCVIGGGLFALSVGDPDGPWPVSYVPLLNPLDLGLGLATAACVLWVSRARVLLSAAQRSLLLAAGAGLGFVWLNGALLRTLHFWGDIPYRLSSFFQSTLTQTSVSVLWATTGVAAMVAASRVASRALWALGAALMIVVALKLMLVDLANSATIARIVSFISVGLLMMLVGYLAPVPPRDEAKASPASPAP